jgi:hypothetical protein
MELPDESHYLIETLALMAMALVLLTRVTLALLLAGVITAVLVMKL